MIQTMTMSYWISIVCRIKGWVGGYGLCELDRSEAAVLFAPPVMGLSSTFSLLISLLAKL